MDEDYWEQYHGAPKIILPLSLAQKFWSNRFGSLTSIRFGKEKSEAEFKKQLLDNLNPQQLGFRVIDLYKQSSEGVQHAVDFSGLFIGLSFFIIVSALILTVLLYSFYIEKLHKEYAVMNILGFTKRAIWAMYLGQGMIFSAIGLIPGALAGYLYAGVILHQLNSVWGGVVNQAHIDLFVSPKSILFGCVFSLSAVCLAIGIKAVSFIRSTSKMLFSGEINLKKNLNGSIRCFNCCVFYSVDIYPRLCYSNRSGSKYRIFYSHRLFYVRCDNATGRFAVKLDV